MFGDINPFLSRFRALKPPERYVEECVIAAVKRVTGVTIRRAEISVRGKTVYITASPAARSEIMLRKSEVLRVLARDMLVENAVSDLR